MTLNTLTQPVMVKRLPKKKVGVLDKKFIYFDNAATGKLSKYAKELTIENFDENFLWANPSSIYSVGRDAKTKLEESRQIIASCINAKPSEIYFTSGSSESISWIINGVLSHLDCKGKTLLTSATEHPAVWDCSKALKIKADYCDVDENGCIQPDRFYQYLTERTVDRNLYGLVEILHVGNELGNVNDITTLAKISHSYGIAFASDITQSVGKISVDVKALGLDYAFGSARKWCGVGGVGFCYINKEAKIKPFPLIYGSQENKNGTSRGGTENVFGIWVAAMCLEKIVNGDDDLDERYFG